MVAAVDVVEFHVIGAKTLQRGVETFGKISFRIDEVAVRPGFDTALCRNDKLIAITIGTKEVTHDLFADTRTVDIGDVKMIDP